MSLRSLAKIGKTIEKYMIDTVTVSRPSGETVNAGTLVLSRTMTTVYTGKAMVAALGDVYDSKLGGQVTAETRYEVGIPASAAAILPNDEIVVDTSVNSVQLVGVRLIVLGQVDSTWQTHRRLTCIRKESGE